MNINQKQILIELIGADTRANVPTRRRCNSIGANIISRLTPKITPRHELRAEKARRNRDAALAAFIGKTAEIDAMLARLQAISDDHFNAHPDDVNWGHVGTLGHYADLLKRITDSAFGEGEFAE